jgi:hypothetical protein
MLLQAARNLLADSVLVTSAYPDDQLDWAIQSAGVYFCNQTLAVVVSKTMAVSARDPVLSLDGDDFDTFQPFYTQNVRIGYSRIEGTDFEHVRTLLDAYPSNFARPKYIAFETPRVATLYPTPDVSYDITLSWCDSFKLWEPGLAQTDPATIFEFNVPDRFMFPIVTFGAVGYLLGGYQVQHFLANKGWDLFLQFCNSLPKPPSLFFRNDSMPGTGQVVGPRPARKE